MTKQATTCYPRTQGWDVLASKSASGNVVTMGGTTIISGADTSKHPCAVLLAQVNFTGVDTTPVPVVTICGVAAQVKVSTLQNIDPTTHAPVANSYTQILAVMLPFDGTTVFSGTNWVLDYSATTATSVAASGVDCAACVIYNVDPTASASFAAGSNATLATLGNGSTGYDNQTTTAVTAQRGDFLLTVAGCYRASAPASVMSSPRLSPRQTIDTGNFHWEFVYGPAEVDGAINTSISLQNSSSKQWTFGNVAFLLRPPVNLQGVQVATGWTTASMSVSAHIGTFAPTGPSSAYLAGCMDPVLIVVPQGWVGSNLAGAQTPVLATTGLSSVPSVGLLKALSARIGVTSNYLNLLVGYLPLRGFYNPVSATTVNVTLTDTSTLLLPASFNGTTSVKYMVAYNVDPISDYDFTDTWLASAENVGNPITLTQSGASTEQLVVFAAINASSASAPDVLLPSPDTNGVAGFTDGSSSSLAWLSYAAPTGATQTYQVAQDTSHTGGSANLGAVSFVLRPPFPATAYNAPTGLAGTAISTTEIDLSWTPPSIVYGTQGSILPSVLMHFDGTNGSTTFTDAVGGTTWTVPGGSGAVISTAQKQFGNASGSFPNTGATGITYAMTAGGPFDLGKYGIGDFTMEYWVYHSALDTNGQTHFAMAIQEQEGFRVTSSSNLVTTLQTFFSGAYASGFQQIGPRRAPLTTGSWHHIAIVRDANRCRMFIDGVEDGTERFAGSPFAPVVGNFTFGYDYLSSVQHTGLQGYLDEFCLTKGVAKYLSAFAPPIAPFSATSPAPPNYIVYRGIPAVGTPAAALFTDTGLSSGTSYTYTVVAASGSTPLSPASSPVTVMTQIDAINGVIATFADSVVFPMTFDLRLSFSEFVYYPMRPDEYGVDLAPAVPNMIINRYKQQPTDTRRRGVDFTLFCQSGEKISAIAAPVVTPVTVPPLTVNNIVVDPVSGQTFAYTVAGGVDGTEYLIQFTTTFNTGNVVDEEVIFYISVFSESQYP